MEGADPTRLSRMRVMDLLGGEIGRVVSELYTDVAEAPQREFHFPTGPRAVRLAGYPEEALERVPEHVLARFAGVGCPLEHVALEPGDAVLDIGSGSGTDLFLASHRVGPSGRVVGVDLTEQMVEVSQAALEEEGLHQAEVARSRAPEIDVDGRFDVVTSNGVVNLIPDKHGVLERLHELLEPGGRLVLADIALGEPPSRACLRDVELWAECLVGSFTEEEYLDALETTGFEEVTVEQRRDYFQHSSSEKTRRTAEDLDAFAWVLTARRPEP